MTTNDFILIGVLIVAAIIGYGMGFGKSLKASTKGIFGIIISIVVCILIGGTLRGIPKVVETIEELDAFFIKKWDFLKNLKLGIVVYYIALFAVAQIARIIVVKVLQSIAEQDNGVMKQVNKLLGAVFFATFVFTVFLLFLAVLKTFENKDFALNIITKLDGISIKLYENNPIVF